MAESLRIGDAVQHKKTGRVGTVTSGGGTKKDDVFVVEPNGTSSGNVDDYYSLTEEHERRHWMERALDQSASVMELVQRNVSGWDCTLLDMAIAFANNALGRRRTSTMPKNTKSPVIHVSSRRAYERGVRDTIDRVHAQAAAYRLRGVNDLGICDQIEGIIATLIDAEPTRPMQAHDANWTFILETLRTVGRELASRSVLETNVEPAIAEHLVQKALTDSELLTAIDRAHALLRSVVEVDIWGKGDE